MNAHAGLEERHAAVQAFRFEPQQEILDFEGSTNNIRRAGIHVRQTAGAQVGIADGFDLFDAVLADDAVEIGKAVIEFFDEHFRAELFGHLGEARKIDEHDRSLVVFAGGYLAARF